MASPSDSSAITFSSMRSKAAMLLFRLSPWIISLICFVVCALFARALSVFFLLLASLSFCSSVLQPGPDFLKIQHQDMLYFWSGVEIALSGQCQI